MQGAICAQCGGHFTYHYHGSGRKRKYCTPVCSKEADKAKMRLYADPLTRMCKCCQAAFLTTHASKFYCSPSCAQSGKRRADAVRVGPRSAIWIRDCASCGILFCAHHRNSQRCAECVHGTPAKYGAGCRCRPCTDAQAGQMRDYFARTGGNKSTPARRAASSRRRALLRGAKSEKINPFEIFERDGYICHICGIGTDPWEPPKHRLAPTIDHIVPLSRGGSHTRDNLATAHRACNSSRGNRETAPGPYFMHNRA